MPVITPHDRALFLHGILDSMTSRVISIYNGTQPNHIGWSKNLSTANLVGEFVQGPTFTWRKTGGTGSPIGTADLDTIEFNILPFPPTITANIDCSSGSPIEWFAVTNAGASSSYAMLGPVTLIGGGGVVALDTLTPALGANFTIQDFRLKYA